MTKKFFQIYIPSVRDLYTWHLEAASEALENKANITIIGSLVQIQFRNQKKHGLIVREVVAPKDFKTQPILNIMERNFFSPSYFELAQTIADENFCSVTKVLAGMIPKEFFMSKTEVKRHITYKIRANTNNEDSKVRGAKQKQALELIINNHGSIDEKILREHVSLATIRSLIKKNIIVKKTGKIIPGLRLYEKFPTDHQPLTNPPFHSLTSEQQSALDQILNSNKPSLLWGITGSGKTEIYKQVIQHQLLINNQPLTAVGAQKFVPNKNNSKSADDLPPTKTALFLLPEIALTPQLIEGFQHSFGVENIAIWHSKLSTQQKIQEWVRMTSGEAKILIGTRSAVLLPIPSLRVIVMDEEHEWTYKNEFAPRFRTHEVVEHIAQQQLTTLPSDHQAPLKLIFGSATPRLESFYRVQKNDWQLVQLTKRVKKTPMPNFSVIDLREEIKKNNPSPISERLDKKIRDALRRKKQVVLFLNKRGYSASTMCQFCSHTFECPDCDSKMKAHKKINRNAKKPVSNLFTNSEKSAQQISKNMHKLVCHVCGHLEWFPDCCPKCKKKNFAFKGWGTQQVEDQLKSLYPQARIVRADADTVTKKSDWNRIHQLFKNKEADILLGTQMISKGLDFEDVELVGIILADVGLNLPDFRAEERIFQLITQVAGRAGRRETQGHIVLQTFQPKSKVFDYILRYDTEGFVNWQSMERKKHHFPPYCYLAKLTISHEDKTISFKAAKNIEKIVLETLAKSSYKSLFDVSAAPAFFPRTHNKYHFHIYVKTTDKKLLHKVLWPLKNQKFLKIDINPSSIL